METRTLDNESMASQALGVSLSERKLRQLEPRLYGWWGRFFNWRLSLGHKEKLSAQVVFAEHLRHGDTGPAVVVSVEPLVVAAYAGELDAVVMLRFDEALAALHGLEEGTRLLCACTYAPMSEVKRYASDVIPGPGASGHFGDAAPLIAEFMSEAEAQIKLLKHALEPELWGHVEALARQHREAFGERARSGSPIQVCFDVS